jgi:regulator of replication initiation timing
VVKILADTNDARLAEAGYQNHILSNALHTVRAKNTALLLELDNLGRIIKSQTQYLHALSAQKNASDQQVLHLREQVRALAEENNKLAQENGRVKTLAESPPPVSPQYARLDGEFRQVFFFFGLSFLSV